MAGVNVANKVNIRGLPQGSDLASFMTSKIAMTRKYVHLVHLKQQQ